MRCVPEPVQAKSGKEQQNRHGRQAIASRDEEENHRQHVGKHKKQQQTSLRGLPFFAAPEERQPEQGKRPH